MKKLNEKIYKVNRSLIKDNRGWFLKTINGNEPYNSFPIEVYLTSAKPGESRGGHYHLVANEWFTLIKGEALLKLSDIETGESMIIELNESFPETIFIPPKIAHSFVNQGVEDFVLLAYTDKKYDPGDTIVSND
jgi:dTDP-4-dehydrorhamnose 3,5-epimerase-like enzyme